MENKITPQNKLKFILGLFIPFLLCFIITGFVLVMIGYGLGTQEATTVNWTMVTCGWCFLGVGLFGYFFLFIYVNIKRYRHKLKENK